MKITKFSKDKTDFIRKYSSPGRHGNVLSVTGNDREKMFNDAWDIVENFLDEIKKTDKMFRIAL